MEGHTRRSASLPGILQTLEPYGPAEEGPPTQMPGHISEKATGFPEHPDPLLSDNLPRVSGGQ